MSVPDLYPISVTMSRKNSYPHLMRSRLVGLKRRRCREPRRRASRHTFCQLDDLTMRNLYGSLPVIPNRTRRPNPHQVDALVASNLVSTATDKRMHTKASHAECHNSRITNAFPTFNALRVDSYLVGVAYHQETSGSAYELIPPQHHHISQSTSASEAAGSNLSLCRSDPLEVSQPSSNRYDREAR